MTFQPIKFLKLKKVRVPLVILCVALCSVSAFLSFSHDVRRIPFLLLGLLASLLLQIPGLHEDWIKHKKSEPTFYFIMAIFVLAFLLPLILFLTLR
jgi:hypothetical protein